MPPPDRPHPPTTPHRARLLKPQLRVAHVSEIDLDHLEALGIAGFVFDLDDTLVHAMEPQADPGIHAWVQAVRERFAVWVVSNNGSLTRVARAAAHLGLPYRARALKPSRRSFRAVLAEMGLPPERCAIVGDQLFTDVLGGNRLGAYTILVDPLSEERRWHRRWMRSLETYMLRRGGGTPYHRPTGVEPRREPDQA
ncbi:MAG: YqeG family HAD IIIA-type phosphatase [Candidatus Sericytochromatia bacterium]|nr:YqeG family HAD IIIA-type phosphatase [Candidatus Sericytochromatia bacterium]